MTALLPEVNVSTLNISSIAARIRDRGRPLPEVSANVAKIVEDVRIRGDTALVEYEERFGGVRLDAANLRVSEAEVVEGTRSAGDELVKALRYSLRRVRRVQGALRPRQVRSVGEFSGFAVGMRWTPLPSVGCYIPGGRASYASSVIMTAAVAKLAGVRRVVIATPPAPDGSVPPEILAAARVAGVDEIYRAGGAQAVAALAYGTESIARVSKIVGPGGRYASEAKVVVSRDVDIDFYAGPTELVVLAGQGCEPRVAAWDLIGQAEHGEDTLCGLVTWSRGFAESVRSELRKILTEVARREQVEGALSTGFAAICDNQALALNFVDALAPEHLEILAQDAGRLGRKIHGPGLKLLGGYAACAASDYVVGTNHVIPTMGLASATGPLSVLDFVKLEWSVRGSRAALAGVLGPLRTLTQAEGLPNHYLSARSRFDIGGKP